jgi:hypothetical protein
MNGEKPTKDLVARLPRIAFWNRTERLHWAVWLYPTADDAARVVSQPGAFLSTFRAQPSRFVRKRQRRRGLFPRAEEETGLRDALGQL